MDWTRLAIEVLCLRPMLGDADNGRLGTGFAIRRGGELWLVTCAHNVEDETFGLRGDADYPMVTLLRLEGPTIDIRDGRRVVFASVDGDVADCVAIEVTGGELPREVWAFPCGNEVRGPVRLTSGLAEPTPFPAATSSEDAAMSSSGLYAIMGYSRDPTARGTPTGTAAHAIPGLPRVRPYMLAYTPGVPTGMSGSLVVQVVGPGRLRLAGMHTHSYAARNVPLGTVGGYVRRVDLPCGGGVPSSVFLAALEAADRDGIQLVNLGAWAVP